MKNCHCDSVDKYFFVCSLFAQIKESYAFLSPRLKERAGMRDWEVAGCVPLCSLWDLERAGAGRSQFMGLKVFCMCSFLLADSNLFEESTEYYSIL